MPKENTTKKSVKKPASQKVQNTISKDDKNVSLLKYQKLEMRLLR